MKLIEQLRSIVDDMLAEGNWKPEEIMNFVRVKRSAEFLFAEDVTSYLEETYKLMTQIQIANLTLKSGKPDLKKAEEVIALVRELTDFPGKLVDRVKTYVQMHQKL